MKKEITITVRRSNLLRIVVSVLLIVILLTVQIKPLPLQQDMGTKSLWVVDTARFRSTKNAIVDSNFIASFISENNKMQSAFVAMGPHGQSVYGLGDDWKDLKSQTGGIVIFSGDQIKFPLHTTSGYTIDSSRTEIDSLFIRGYVISEVANVEFIEIAGKNDLSASERVVSSTISPYLHVTINFSKPIDLFALCGAPVFNKSGYVVGSAIGQFQSKKEITVLLF